jgi:uncharacterized protein (TIGR02271 family)
MDRDMTGYVPTNGMDVIGADGEKIGEIDAVERDYFVVRKGFFFPQDHYIPMTAVSSYDEDGKLYLNVTKDEALEQEWTSPPVATTEAGYDTAGTTTADAGYVATDIDREPNVDTDYVADRDVADANVAGTVDRDAHAHHAGHERTVDVHEEELAARTREVERGEVRIDKDVVEEQQTLEVPVTEEEVEVTRRRVDRDVTDADHAFEEGTIEVPLRGEEVEVEKRARVVEEIDIDKTAREHTEQVSDTVRREEVRIEGDNIDVDRTDRKGRKDDGLI